MPARPQSSALLRPQSLTGELLAALSRAGSRSYRTQGCCGVCQRSCNLRDCSSLQARRQSLWETLPNPREANQRARSAILSALAHEERTWIDLLKTTRLSKKTLNKHLSELRRKRLVIRQVDSNSEKYPRPVYYCLTKQARMKARPLLDMAEFWRALGEIDDMIATTQPGTIRGIVDNTNTYGGPFLVLFLRVLLEYDYKPDQVGISLGLWYCARAEALTRKIYGELVADKEEATAALNEELRLYFETLIRFVRAARLSLPGIDTSVDIP